MQTLHLIRHTIPQVASGVCYGQLDIDVADTFQEEAPRVLHWLPPVDLVITSPLRRARRLAEYLARERHCELSCDDRLMEKHFGAWEGKTWDEIPRREVDAWAADILGHIPPGGESVQHLLQRVQSFLDEVAHKPQRSIAVVAHAGPIRTMLALSSGIPLAETLAWQVDYGTVISLRLPA